ncbi:MAG: RIP metalloprotease RseP [Eubacteriaceae bacterium]|nr:RIP metalloprotease RseP [Eubacteriaceae bacterium]
MSTFVTILVAVLIFGFLIMTHEYGHFLAARRMGVDVLEFSVGMGPLLWKKKKGATQYSVRALPIGGYCRMKGEEEDEEGDWEAEGCLYAAPPAKRIVIMAAGACMNLLTAVLIFFILLCMNGTDATTVISAVAEGSPAMEAGIEAGDKIIRIDDTDILRWEDITFSIREGTGEEVTVTVIKASGEQKSYTMVPRYDESQGAYLIGISPRIKTNVFKALGRSFYLTGYYMILILRLLGQIITGKMGMEAFSGPIGATVIIGQYIPYGIQYVLEIAASIAVSLGLFNLLPIPALDGSRIVFCLIELIKGSPVNRDLEAKIHTVGMILLLIFAAFIAYRDVITYIL